MKRKARVIITTALVGSLIMSTNVFAGEIEKSTQGSISEEISPRISVSKYVEVDMEYPTISRVPANYYYSYYDHDYKTTLHGLLPLVATRDMGIYVQAIFAGYCSGSI